MRIRQRHTVATGICLTLILGCCPLMAFAQAINPLWLGEWRALQSNLAHPEGSLQISQGIGVTQARIADKVCALAYDGQISAHQITRHIQERKDVQLDLKNWTGLAQQASANAQLVGLRREFEQALQIIAMIPEGNFRRVRLKGAACTSDDDVFYLLSGSGRSNQHLYRINLPNNSVGVEVTLHTLAP